MITITGASGMIGQKLLQYLKNKGIQANTIGRGIKNGEKNTFQWDIKKQLINSDFLNNTETIIHLAGATVSKRWTESYKKEIAFSRVASTQLLYETLAQNKHHVKTVICASATGIYGNTNHEYADEQSKLNGTDFLGKVCIDWEKESMRFASLGVRLVILRIGVVLSDTGGFVKEMKTPVSYRVGGWPGNGDQQMSWIHVHDLCRMIDFAIHHNINGIYNAVSPYPDSQKHIIQQMAMLMNKKLWVGGIPEWILKLMLGEMSSILLSDQLIYSKKIQSEGFTFQFPTITEALSDILHNK
jgi:uncharacterized protein (TIGR01777 family)